MVNRKSAAITARRQARERLTRERAEQAARNRENEADLADFLTSEQQIAAADAHCQTAIRIAHERHRGTVDDLKRQQAACLARMNQRGETTAAISDRTGLTTREVKHLINAARRGEESSTNRT